MKLLTINNLNKSNNTFLQRRLLPYFMIISATFLFFNKGYKTKNRVLQLIFGQNNIIDVCLRLIIIVAVNSY